MAEATQQGRENLPGHPLSAGVCRGKLLVIDRPRPVVQKRHLEEHEVPEEINRLERALAETRHQILEVQHRVSESMGAEESSIFDAHLLVLEDRAPRAGG